MIKWYEGPVKEEDVVVSTRVRVARNLKNYNFPKLLNIQDSEKLTDEIYTCLKEDLSDTFKFFSIKDMEVADRISFVERHLISIDLAKNTNYGSFIIREDEKINIMVNEEDHVRIQALNPGLNLSDCWELVDEIDDLLESKLDYAYDKDYGYLTSCPSNVGTGLRASVMLHLPALKISGNLNNLIEGLSKLGLAVRGIYGEGTKGIGDFYQISNQLTLGQSEEEIIDKLKGVTYQIIDRERNLRTYLVGKQNLELEDKIYRALGILKNARLLDIQETLDLLSIVRFGVEIGKIENLTFRELMNLITKVQIGNIKVNHDIEDNKQIDRLRADIVRKFLEDREV